MTQCGDVGVATHYNFVCVTVEQAYSVVYKTVQYWLAINTLGHVIYPVPVRLFLFLRRTLNSIASAKEPERRAVAGTGGPVGSRGGPGPSAQDRATGGYPFRR